MICVSELCWLVSGSWPFEVQLTCPDGTLWTDVDPTIICEGTTPMPVMVTLDISGSLIVISTHCRLYSVVRSAGTSGGPSKKKKHPLPARSNAASSLEELRQRYKVSTFGSSGPRTDSGLCMGP